MSRAKETIKGWIDYDPAVTAAASMTQSLSGSTRNLKPKVRPPVSRIVRDLNDPIRQSVTSSRYSPL